MPNRTSEETDVPQTSDTEPAGDRTARWLEQAEVFFGELNPAQARLYVELPAEPEFAATALRGRIVGPRCEYSRTLTTEVPLRELEPGATRLCGALLPDPCCWTPDLPFVYELELIADRQGAATAQVRRTIGIRPLGTAGEHLILDGKRMVVRGIDRALFPREDVRRWREVFAAMLVREPQESLLADCTRHGVLVCAEQAGDPAAVSAGLRSLARHPCVGLVLIDSMELPQPPPRNLLVGIRLPSEAADAWPSWAQLIACDAAEVSRLEMLPASRRRPVLVLRRPEDAPADPAAARRECDFLQRTLAGQRAWAGYLIRAEDPPVATESVEA